MNAKSLSRPWFASFRRSSQEFYRDKELARESRETSEHEERSDSNASNTLTVPPRASNKPWLSVESKPYAQVLASLSVQTMAAELAKAAQNGLQLFEAELTEEGLGGTYLIRASNGEMVAVLKPSEEEPYAAGNPKRDLLVNSNGAIVPPRIGFREGEGYIREVAAFLLDHQSLAGVPLTALVRYAGVARAAETGREGIASLQQYVPHDSSCEDVGVSIIPADQVHKIALLDIRLLNSDRHAGNMLICYKQASNEEQLVAEANANSNLHESESRKKRSKSFGTDDAPSLSRSNEFARTRRSMHQARSIQLVPIDHGYALGTSLGEVYFEWMNWPQAEIPLSAELRQYVANLDANHDATILSALGFGAANIRNMRIATMLLQKAVAAALTLREIAVIMCREQLDAPSKLERIVDDAMALSRKSSVDFYFTLAKLLDQEIESSRVV
jgi:hypothetical protein